MSNSTIYKSDIFKSAAILTVISFGVKIAGMLFRVYLSVRIGAEGLGLYQLVMSVYSLFATFATAGFTLAVSRLVAERLADPNENVGRANAKRVLHMAIIVSLLAGIVASIFLFVFSGRLAESALHDSRTTVPLRILSASMIFMSVSACFKGYFIAVRQIYKPSLTSLFEQLTKIFVTISYFTLFLSETNDPGKLCIGIVAGITIGETASYIVLTILYLFSRERVDIRIASEKQKDSMKDVLSVTLPIASGTYITSALHTIESVLIPTQFMRFGGDSSSALAEFGLIRGMVIPILFFPFSFLSSLVSIMVPEISRLNTLCDKTERNAKISRIMTFTFVFSIAAGGAFAFFSEGISVTVYKTAESADAIRVLALVTPFMYIETICDGILKAIGEQSRTLRYSLYNSVLRIVAVLLYIPRTGVHGYLILLIVSNTFSFLLCIGRLKKVTNFSLDFVKSAFIPFVAMLACGYCGLETVKRIGSIDIRLETIVSLSVYILLYGAVIALTIKKKGKKIWDRKAF